MTDYALHYFPESGNSYKLALMLTLCGQTFEPIWTDFGSGITWTEAWLPLESGYVFADTHPAIHAWLGRIAALPGWLAPYDILPGKRLRCYV